MWGKGRSCSPRNLLAAFGKQQLEGEDLRHGYPSEGCRGDEEKRDTMPSPGETAVTGTQGNKAAGDAEEIHTITLLAQKRDFSRTSAQIVLESVVEMVGDVLCSNNAQGALTAIAEACSLPWTAKTTMLLPFSQDNPRIHAKILEWLSRRDHKGEGEDAILPPGKLAIHLQQQHSLESKTAQGRPLVSQLPSKDANVKLLPPFQGCATVTSLGV